MTETHYTPTEAEEGFIEAAGFRAAWTALSVFHPDGDPTPWEGRVAVARSYHAARVAADKERRRLLVEHPGCTWVMDNFNCGPVVCSAFLARITMTGSEAPTDCAYSSLLGEFLMIFVEGSCALSALEEARMILGSLDSTGIHIPQGWDSEILGPFLGQIGDVEPEREV
jgi:hypothetical protein